MTLKFMSNTRFVSQARIYFWRLFLIMMLVASWFEPGLADPLLDHVSNSNAPTTQFKVFDSTQYIDKPDLSKFGLTHASILYEGSIWGNGVSGQQLPNSVQVAKAVKDTCINDELCILDIERWSLKGSSSTISENLEKYGRVLEWSRRAAPRKIIGYYGLPVGRDYWRAIDGAGSVKYKSWQAENDNFKGIAAGLDVSLPSLYAFYGDRPAWVNYAIANIEECRRINPGRPVYAFLMPKFHESNKVIGNMDIPGSFWKLQLDTARKYADGVVIWGGYKQQWKESAEWWQVTKQFVSSIK